MRFGIAAIAAFLTLSGLAERSKAAVTVLGTDAIYVAGRTNFVVNTATDPLLTLTPPDTATVPQSIGAFAGETFTFAASGTVQFSSTDSYSVDGALPDAGITGLNAISGYTGPKGALVGVFLDNTPTQNVATPPAALNFTNTSFTSLSPGIGQVFFIGDGLTGTGSGTTQNFIAPAGATRLFLGIADGFNYAGQPGQYEDNSGSFTVNFTPEPVLVGLIAPMALLLARRARFSSVGDGK